MILVVEGPSAAGKTTWVTAHCAGHAVWEHRPTRDAPDRRSDPEQAGRFWADANAVRWRRALEMEARHGIAFCDTDPFKLHYVWCLWMIDEVSVSAWRAEAAINRRRFEEGSIGMADLVLCAIPDENDLRRRRESDMERTRSRFDVHARLAQPLQEWYSAIDSLDRGRVRWEFPSDGRVGDPPPPRTNRSDPILFDRLLGALPRS